MLSCTRSLLSLVARRRISTNTVTHERFPPYDLLRSDLVNEDGLVTEEIPVRSKKTIFEETDHMAKKPHCYGTMNFMVEGYDIVVVEKFAQYVHRLILKQKVKVKEMYALPTEFLTVRHLGEEFSAQPTDMQPDAELPVHFRVVQVGDLQTTIAPILLRSLASVVPPGVKLTVHEYKEEDFLKRHKENTELQDAKFEYQKLRYGK